MDKKKPKSKAGSILLRIIVVLILVVGAGILLYPTVSNLINEWQNSEQITLYEGEVESREDEELEKLLAQARAYNAQHTVNTIVDVFDEEAAFEADREYEALLNPAGNGVMGYIVIPKISVELAVYHGTGTEALEQGVGHIQGTSLPVGGSDTHSVLSAHRGLPSARLFTDLDQIETGDKFYVTVLGETMAYEVDAIRTVEPSETQDLAIIPGEDLITLVTCTPYGVNSHRLLVRGHRIPYEVVEQEEKTAVQKTHSDSRQLILFAAIGTAAAVAVLVIIVTAVRRAKRRRMEKDGAAEEK